MPYSATLKENNHLILEYRMKHVAVRIFATKTRETTAKNPVQNLVIILTDPQFLTMIVVRNLSKNLCMITFFLPVIGLLYTESPKINFHLYTREGANKSEM